MRNIFGKSKVRNEKLAKFLRRGKPRKEKFERFKPISRLALLKKRLDLLEDTKKRKIEEEIHLKILKSLKTVFKEDPDFEDVFGKDSKSAPTTISKDDGESAPTQKSKDDGKTEEEKIYDAVKKHLDFFVEKKLDVPENLSPFVFIKRYSKSEQHDILPESMQSDFDNIPDENGMSKFEVVETIRQFGEILNNITNKEKDLNSKLDCSLYAEQYLDTLEQIATLYHRRIIPKKAADYFENKFAYGINLFNWYQKYVDFTLLEFNPDSELNDEKKDKEKKERWTDFKWFCRGGDLPKNKITQFDEDDHKIDKGVLPTVMYYYEKLPDEEGIKPSEVLEIMRNYSKQLSDLSGKEPELKTRIDCSVYAKQYLDTLDQIAYLFNKNSLVTDSDNYFENNFTYGLTLKKWYFDKVYGADEQKRRWNEFDCYVKSYNKDHKPEIKSFDMGSVLPPAMLNYDNLQIDLLDIKNENKVENKE